MCVEAKVASAFELATTYFGINKNTLSFINMESTKTVNALFS